MKKNISEITFTPSVIEPTFGIGRIVTAVMEHAFQQREADEQRCVMSFKPCIAPIKVGIYKLINNNDFDPLVEQIHMLLTSKHCNITCKIDKSQFNKYKFKRYHL